MNNMFVSLLLYLTVRFHQQRRLRLTLARAGAFAIGLLSRTPPLLCCVLLLSALSKRSQSICLSVVSTTGMHACVSSCRCVVARSLLHAPVSASRGMRRVTSTQRRFLLVIWFMLGFREGLVLRSSYRLGTVQPAYAGPLCASSCAMDLLS